ncbi:uncharacterized protein LY89DRAFT_750774 [Mollisia scopiformis]|uniref:SprT-like domain-containing protein n=1 Tax=Mollisia scopiformis TaxID=149040 RepID=A0A194X5H5_MOLSC|nr:uncharacterized protein LY89DRAFT_750774 [Mollisia scopiformis]KUJ15433.1 hypothetical protein LY89DRAFT_750774 [Mollisia scopiformis]
MTSQQDFHIPPSLSRQYFELGNLKLLSNSREAIFAALVAHIEFTARCKPEDIPPRAKRAFARLENQMTWKLGKVDDIENLKLFFDLFNDMYFNGLLTGYCELELIEEYKLQRRRLKLKEAVGLCQPYFPGEGHPRYKEGRVFCTLSVAMSEKRDSVNNRWSGPGQRIKHYLDTLIHEMIHALFDIFTCRCPKGCKEKHNLQGGGGHHLAFQAAAHAIGSADIQYLSRYPCLSLSLTRYESFVGDLQLGYNLPPPSSLKSVDLDINVIMELLKEARVKTFEREKLLRPQLVVNKNNRCIRDEFTVDSRDRHYGFERKWWGSELVSDCDETYFPLYLGKIDVKAPEWAEFKRWRNFEQRAINKYRDFRRATQDQRE